MYLHRTALNPFNVIVLHDWSVSVSASRTVAYVQNSVIYQENCEDYAMPSVRLFGSVLHLAPVDSCPFLHAS